MKTLYTKKGELKSSIKTAIDGIHGTKIYTDQWVGSGRRKNLRSTHSNVVEVLDALKLKYKTGNDAPRGGQEGNFILISTRALKKINSVLK